MTLEHTLAALAAKYRPATLAAARDVLRAQRMPLKHARALRDACAEQAKRHAARLAARRAPSFRRGADYWPRSRAAARIAAPLAHRRLAQTARAVLLAFDRAGLRAQSAPAVMYGTGSLDYRIRSYYKKHSDRFATVEHSLTLHVPANWRRTVERAGLAVVDGLMTLAARATAPGLYAAVWIEQGRGYRAAPIAGYIARAGALTYHALTSDAAREGLARKLAGRRAAPRVQRLAARVAARPDAIVSVALARGLGLCEPGIRAWCARAGIDVAREAIPVTEAYAAYRRAPAPDARRAIIAALRA